MTRRAGLSLIEVLAALFIMGIGTMAILTLFPLGALTMAQAIKDDRTAQAAASADAYMRWYWRHQVVELAGETSRSANEAFYRGLRDPNDSLATTFGATSVVPVTGLRVG